jgi:hypothetical protein
LLLLAVAVAGIAETIGVPAEVEQVVLDSLQVNPYLLQQITQSQLEPVVLVAQTKR